MEQNVARDVPSDAAAAFEALRREVALLNVALAGLAAARASTPDYSETLGEISKGVSIAIGRLGKVLASPAFAMSPEEIARQITEAGDAARRQDREAMRQAQEGLVRAMGDLRVWIDSARLARSQNRRLVQAGLAGALAGALLGVWAPKVIAHAAPDRWAWPEKLAAHTLDLEPWAAGERLLAVSDPGRWQFIRELQRTDCQSQIRSHALRGETARRNRR